MAHPNLVHCDDVEPRRFDRGDIEMERRRLGAAGGARAVGLSRYSVAAGKRMMPVHVHGDEEEICFVVGGAGLSIQDGRAYAVAAGDCIVHRPEAEEHTMVAGPEGLDVLMFGEGSRTGSAWLPRAKVMWMAPRWIPPDGPHPWEAEVAAGPLDVPAPEAERPANVVSMRDVEPQRQDLPGHRVVEHELGAAAGSVAAGLNHHVLEPGNRTYPLHWHTMEEEVYVVLAGDGVAMLGDEEHPIRAGSVLVRPPATRVAHALRAGDGGLTYLVYGTRVPGDICFYPASEKLNIDGVRFRVQQLKYWDGED
jgi:uncharacterized cupin superfamily protein